MDSFMIHVGKLFCVGFVRFSVALRFGNHPKILSMVGAVRWLGLVHSIHQCANLWFVVVVVVVVMMVGACLPKRQRKKDLATSKLCVAAVRGNPIRINWTFVRTFGWCFGFPP